MTGDISKQNSNFESYKKYDSDNNEYWNARELTNLFGYDRWENFSNVIDKATKACTNSGAKPSDHFRDITKMIETAKGAKRSVFDFELTRYACYLIAQNGDPKKKEIALAQSYFAVQTRRQELSDKVVADVKRIEARKKLSETEKKFATSLYEKQVDGKGIAEVRSAGDEKLFGGNSTKSMKEKYDVKKSKPLADVLPTVTLKAKDLAAEMTMVNSDTKELTGKERIKFEHIENNEVVRAALIKRGIKPENLPPEEDIKKVENKLKKLDRNLMPEAAKKLIGDS